MATQIEIGLEITDMARQDVEKGETPLDTFNGLVGQCLRRDDDWKAFYAEQMEKVTPGGANEQLLKIYATELAAKQRYIAGDYATGVKHLQSLIDSTKLNADDKGWYLQEMARYLYRADRPESQRLQIAEHKANRLLL